MSNILGVPAQEQHSANQIMSGAVVLSAVSFLFFCNPERRTCRRTDSRSAFTQKTKKDAAAITHATKNR